MTAHTWIKICGLTNAADARLAAELGADAVGFVFHRMSPRACPLDQAKVAIRKLGRVVVTIGVWLDEPADEVLKSARFVGCDLVQSYAPETAIALRDAGLDVLPAVPPWLDAKQSDSWSRFCASWPGLVLVDRARGIGAAAPSATSPALAREASPVAPERMILAGRLTPATVQSALRAFHCRGVDVSSGVESEPGKKCRRKLAAFIREVRAWDATASSGVSAGNMSPKR